VTCYTGTDVRFRRTRYLILFVAAMFFASNVAAAVRACVVDLATQGHIAVSAPAAAPGESKCPPTDDAGPCLTHYAQSYQNDEQKFSLDVPSSALAPVLIVFHPFSRAKPEPDLRAAAPLFVGPPLTILFGNFRN